MKEYEVTVPIAGIAYITVYAESEEAAIEKAVNEVTLSDIDRWEALARFHKGNVCYCPRPWEAEAECVSEADEAEVPDGQ